MKKSLFIISMSCLFVIGTIAYGERDRDAPQEGDRAESPEARQRDGQQRERRARDGEGERERGSRDGDTRGRRQGPPPNPVMMALDTDKDGELSADEIANAAAALKELDKNSDGKLSDEEIHPPRPPRDGDRRRGGPRDGEQRPERERGPRDDDRPPRDADRE